MPRSKLIGMLLLSICTVGIVACSDQNPEKTDAGHEARLVIEQAIGGPEYGSVLLVQKSWDNGFLNRGTACSGREVTLSRQADSRTLSRVLEALSERSWCLDQHTKISFADHDTVIYGAGALFGASVSDFANITDAVYETWPQEVHLVSQPESSALFRTSVPVSSVQLGSLADAVASASVPSLDPPTEDQASVRIKVSADQVSESAGLMPGNYITFDPDLSATAAELTQSVAHLESSQPGSGTPWGMQLDIAASSISGTILLPVPPIQNPENHPVSRHWGALVGDLPGSPQGVNERESWAPVWAAPSDTAITAASKVHALISQSGLRDDVEVLLLGKSDLGNFYVGHFDPAVPSAQRGLASSHPDYRG